jgi:phage gpG-like protein
MPISIQVRNIEKLESMGAVITGTKDKLLSDLVRVSKKFGETAVLTAKRNYLSGPRPEKLGRKSGNLASKIHSKVDQNGNLIDISIGTNVSYAAVHEMGTDKPIHVSITKQMRKYFWRMFKKTGDDKFKWMALTNKTQFNINIKPRPFLRPSLEDGMPTFQENIARVLGNLNFVGATDGE